MIFSNKIFLDKNMCKHEQCKSSDYTQVILVHVDVVHRPTPENCDDSVFEIADSEDVKGAQQAHTIYGTSINRCAKLGQIQEGLQRAIQDSTKGGCNNFLLFTR